MQKFLLYTLLSLSIVSLAHAQSPDGSYAIRFKTLHVTPKPNATEYLSSFPAANELPYQSLFFKIVQFYEIPGVTDRETMKSAGVELLDYLPEMAYFAAFSVGFDNGLLAKMRIRSILDVDPAYKLHPDLYSGNYPSHALTENGMIRLIVSYYPNLEPEQTFQGFLSAGVQITGRDDFSKLVYAVAPVSSIGDIAALPFVMFVEPAFPEPDPENSTGRTLHHTNVIASDYPAGRHYDGTGVQLMLQDDGIIGPHIDYQGRIGAQYLTNNGGNHGDHCAGIMMGAGNVDPKGKGNAFGAGLYVYSVSPNYPGFTAIPTVYNSLGIRVTSASYGDGCNSGYTSLTRTLDLQVRTYPSLMHVFSAGNSGTSNCGYGAGSGWGNITGGHKQGKNVLAVANLNYRDELAGSSSRGPAHDGRIKPDIGAKGTDVYSTINPNDYDYKSGTSMACPGVAGTLAQLIHAWRTVHSGSDPMAGLLKATILNTAEDLGNPGPDFKYGWGRINALRAVQVIEEGRFDSGVITQGATATHTINVPAGTAQLRVMIYWTDYEGSVNTDLALVNNLDMTLADPASVIWQPWVLSHFPHPDSLNKPAARGVDDRNNMEQVTLDNPAAGTYQVTVLGAAIPQGPQTYYVVYEFIPQAVALTYPVGGELLAPGETEIVRWDAFGNSETFTLAYSGDNGQSWENVAENLAGSTRYYIWTVPPAPSAQALLRITRGGTSGQSTEPFQIFGIPCNLTVDWACDTVFHLSWSGVAGAASYEVYTLGEKYMEPAGITAATSMIMGNPNPTGTMWLSVSATGTNGEKGRRAIALEKPPVTYNCNPADALLASAPTAEWGVFQSCMALTGLQVPVEVRNFGLLPIVDPILHFQLNGGPVISETMNGTILPDSILPFTFSETIDISDTGSYVLKTWVAYTLDQNPENDTLTVPLEVIGGSMIAMESLQTFDGWAKCLSAGVCDLYACIPGDNWINLANGTYDQHDWRTFSGSTPSAGTGPDADHTTGTSTGKYLYVEPSIKCLQKTTSIATPCIDLTNAINPQMSFWYHAYGPDMGWFHVDLFDGSRVYKDVAPPVAGNQGNEWQELAIDLTPWAGKVVGIRFRGKTGCKDKGDFAIDDFRVAEVITSSDPLNIKNSGRLSIYPNPAGDYVTVSLQEAGNRTCTMKILDLYGRDVFSREAVPSGNVIRETLDLRSLVNGVYLLEIKASGMTFRNKLVIRR